MNPLLKNALWEMRDDESPEEYNLMEVLASPSSSIQISKIM